MNHKKILIILLLPVISILAVIFYLKLNVPLPMPAKKPAIPEAIALQSAKLEAKIQQLNDLLHAVVQLNRSLDASSLKEKKEKLELEKTLKEASGKNESLAQELAQAKTGLALTQPIKQKMSEVETFLPKMNLAPGKEKEITLLLQEMRKTLSSIDSQIPAFLNENKSYKEEADTLRQQVSKKEEAILNDRKAQDARLKEQGALAQNLKNVSDELKKAQNANSSLDARAAGLKKAQDALQEANASLNKELDALKKDLHNTRAMLTQALKEKTSAIGQLDEARQKAQESIEKQTEQKETLTAFEKENETAQKELSALKKQLAQLTEDRESLIEDLEAAESAQEDIQKLHDEITELNRQLEQLAKEYAELKNAHAAAQETIAQKELELGKRANRILTAEEKRAEAEAKLSELSLKAREIERESALLRQQNVAAQLEKEALRAEFNTTKLRLSELEGQASLISTILTGAKAPEGQTPPLKEESKKIDLEIYPESENKADSDAKN